MAILGVVLASLLDLTVNGLMARSKNYAVSEVHQNARFVFDVMSQRIRAANAVNIGSSTFNSNPGILSLQMDTGGVNPTIFSRDPATLALRIQEGASPETPLTTNRVQVTNLVFKNLSSTGARHSIRILMTLQYANSSDPQFSYSYDFQTTVSVRQ